MSMRKFLSKGLSLGLALLLLISVFPVSAVDLASEPASSSTAVTEPVTGQTSEAVTSSVANSGSGTSEPVVPETSTTSATVSTDASESTSASESTAASEPTVPGTEASSEATEPTEEVAPGVDDVAPVLNVTVPDKWVKDSIVITVEVTDDSAVDEDSFRFGEGDVSYEAASEFAVVEDKGNNKFELTINTPKNTTYKVFVKDSFGNVGSKDFTITKVDRTAPVAKDLEIKITSTDNSVTDKILGMLTFGIYSQTKVTFEFSVNSNGGTPIKELKLNYVRNGEDKVITKAPTDADKDGVYTADVVFDWDNVIYKEIKITLTDEANNSNSEAFALNTAGVKIYLGDKKLANNIPFAELIFSTAAPNVVIDNENGATYNGNPVYSATVKNDVSGIDESTLVVKLNDEVITDKCSIKYEDDASIKGKHTKATITYTSNGLDSGKYNFEVSVKSLCGVEGKASVSTGLDNEPPEIVVDIKDKDIWSKVTKKVELTVTDKPDGSSISGENITVTGADGEKVDVVNNSFDATRQDYTITAKDKFGKEATYTIKAEDIKFDAEAPSLGGYTYTPDTDVWKKDPVKVSVTPTDELSGIDAEKIKVTDSQGNDVAVKAEGSGFSFDAETYGVYNVTVYDIAGNDLTIPTKEILVDSAEATVSKIEFKNANKVESFGAYAKDEKGEGTLVTVTVKGNDAPVTSITLNDFATADEMQCVDALNKIYTQSFVIGASDTVNVLAITATTAAGVVTNKENLKDVEIVGANITLDEYSDLYEYVVNNSSVDIDIKPVGFAVGANGLYSGKGQFNITLSNKLAGIDQKTIKVIYNDTEVALTDKIVTTSNENGKCTDVSIVLKPEAFESGTHTVKVVADTLCGVNTDETLSIDIDNSNPAISIISYSNNNNQIWSKEKVTVNFKVLDEPAGHAGGIATIKVIGNENGVVYLDTKVNETGQYSFDADLCQTYTLYATDSFGLSSTLTTEKVLFDNESANIYDVNYKLADGSVWDQKSWVSGKISISFNADDKTASTDDEVLSGIKSIKVVGNSNGREYINVNNETKPQNAVTTVEFDADLYQSYTITVEDFVGNTETKVVTATTWIDSVKPEITGVKFEMVENEGLYDKLLHFVTFGIYTNRELRMVVNTYDAKASSGICNIDATYGDALMEAVKDSFVVTDRTPDECVATKVFKLPMTEDYNVYKAKDIKFTVADVAGNEYTPTLSEIKDVILNPEALELSDEFEIVITEKEPLHNEISIEADQVTTNKEGNTIYSDKLTDEGEKPSDVRLQVTIEDAISGIDVDSLKVHYINNDGTVSTMDEIPGKYSTISTLEDESEKVVRLVVEYYSQDELSSGTYGFGYEIKNNSGNATADEVTFSVDNAAPKITDLVYSNNDNKTWTNGKVNVEFKVSDVPVENFGGVKSVKVIGVENGKEYINLENENGKAFGTDTLNFDADLAQQYEITATDVFGREVNATTARVKVDTENSHITNITYSNDENDTWVKDPVKVKFKVDEKSDEKQILGDYLSGIKSVKVTGDTNGKEYKNATYDEIEELPENTYEFTADLYQTYTIEVTDNAGIVTTMQTAAVKIDTNDPIVASIEFKKKDASAVEKILNFLTFGIYSNDEIHMRVKAFDAVASSGVDDIVVMNGNKELKVVNGSTEDKNNSPNKSSLAKTFVIPSIDAIYHADNISISVTDISGRMNAKEKTLTELEDYFVNEGLINFEDNFEIVSSDHKASISFDIDDDVVLHEGTSVYKGEDGTTWFSGSVDFNFNVTEAVAKINQIKVELNGTDITKFCEFDQSVENNTNGVFTNFTTHTGEKVDEVNFIIDTSLPNIKTRVNMGVEDSSNTIKVTVTGNNGVVTEKTFDKIFFVDDAKPIITGFEFENISDNTLNGEIEADTDDNKPADVIKTDYGYFFQNDAKVTVSASDFIDEAGNKVDGSGIKSIKFYGISVKDNFSKAVELMSGDFTVEDGVAKATFEVEAGFKGTFYAYAFDNVNNMSNFAYADNTIVEDQRIHDAESYASATVLDTNYVKEDNNGNRLFNGNVTLDLFIKDTYSGLKEVTYTIEGPGFEKETVTVNAADAAAEGWQIEKDMNGNYETNLITTMRKTIVLDGSKYNCNDIIVKITGVDNADFEIICNSSEKISIDTTAPQISVTYNDVKGNTAGGNVYYKDMRVATIKVTERNFNPADFDWTKLINTDGATPAFVSGIDWTTTYADYTDNSVHTATVTFANDGDYEVTLNFVDMAGNRAAQYGTEKFTIDTIDPVITVSYDNNDASNTRYYDAGRIATVTIKEHNFSLDGLNYAAVVTMPDNSTPMAAPQIVDWSHSGDTHTAYIRFADDGKYEFTVDYTDMSLRVAQQYKQETFYVDTDTNEPVFNNVKDKTAYDGDVAPQIVFDDYNFSSAEYKLTRVSYDFAKGANANEIVKNLVPLEIPSGTGTVVTFDSFPVEEQNDGIYILTATIVDLAGNTKTTEIMFSVNRFGSTFMLGDEATQNLAEVAYTNNAPALVVFEINVNPVTEQNVSLSYNTTTRDLIKGTEFDIKAEGGETSWYKYIYDIAASNFVEEGNYTITVSSVDKFEKKVSNRTANTDGDIVRNCPLSFVVDKTKPVVSIEGVESGKAYKEATKTLSIMCLDTNIDKESLEITLDDKKLEADKDYTVDDTLVGELSVELILNVGTEEVSHTVNVSVKDLAGNEGEDKVEDFTLSATLLTLYLDSPVAIISTIAVLLAVVAVIIIISIKKRKAKE